MVIAGDIAPSSPVVPHNDHAVLTGEKVAVGLPRVPILIELGSTGRAGASLALCTASMPWCPISVLLVQAPQITRCSCQWLQLRLRNLGPIPRDGEGPRGVVGMGTGWEGGIGSTAYQGAAVGPLEVPLDGAVVEADPLVLAVLFWGQRRAWGAPPSPGTRQGGELGGVAGRGQQSPSVPMPVPGVPVSFPAPPGPPRFPAVLSTN